MKYLESYLNRIKENGNSFLADAVSNTAEKIAAEYIRPFSYKEHVVALLLGNVQSGKTSHLFGLIGSAADEGFRIFILLTTDNTLLQQQTLFRVRNDLNDFCVCGETDEYAFNANQMRKPVIIVLKKNSNVLRKWKNNLLSSRYCEGNALFIVDDEADAASLNTLVNKKKQSTINKRLTEIIDTTASSIYLQVTGTPQALLLQSHISRSRPYFTHYFPPGNGYIGGNILFPPDKPQYVILTDNEEASDLLKDDEIAENGLLQALLYHLTASADIFLNGGKVSNFIIHPSVETAQQSKFSDKIASYLNEIAGSVDEKEVSDAFKTVYDDLSATKPDIRPFNEIMKKIISILEREEINRLILNSKELSADNVKYESGINVIVGGNVLSRGITFPKLQTTYYCRVSKNPQADTMWQHARMFGYDRELGLMRVFMPPILYKLFSDINATNNSIISQIERKKPEDVNIHYPEKLRPTRKNVLDIKAVLTFTGGVDYFPFSPENKSIEAIDELLLRFKEETYSVNLNIFINIIENIVSESDDWKPNNFIGILQTMLSGKPSAQGKLIVRRERDIGKGTGTMLSPNDRALGKAITDVPVLTMYKVTGDKGWGRRKIWVPNIKLPGTDVYYCI
ncbi:MAG: Z1 domain-containing protein [Treponema sp.]|nr:Z1 domain-containing protein [Treponema sp.]